jgi:polysaccharide pyruvyl transferase WcaK-like protein
MNSPARLSAETPDPAVHRAYLATMAAFARWLLAHDYDVRLLIGDFAYDRDVLTEFAASLKREMPPDDPGRVLDTPALSVEELLSQIAATDLVVATRFHNVLLALLLKKPVASVSFHHKSVSLMRAMGLSEHSRDIGDLDLEWLIGQVDALQRNASALIDRMSERVEENRKILDDQYGLIFDGVGTQAERSELVRAGPPIA